MPWKSPSRLRSDSRAVHAARPAKAACRAVQARGADRASSDTWGMSAGRPSASWRCRGFTLPAKSGRSRSAKFTAPRTGPKVQRTQIAMRLWRRKLRSGQSMTANVRRRRFPAEWQVLNGPNWRCRPMPERDGPTHATLVSCAHGARATSPQATPARGPSAKSGAEAALLGTGWRGSSTWSAAPPSTRLASVAKANLAPHTLMLSDDLRCFAAVAVAGCRPRFDLRVTAG